MSSGLTKREVWQKFTGYKEEHGKILIWMRRFGYISTDNNRMCMKKEIIQDDKLGQMIESERIRSLEERLKEAELKAIAYSKMIDLAEKEFNISIRKKYNTKPLKK